MPSKRCRSACALPTIWRGASCFHGLGRWLGRAALRQRLLPPAPRGQRRRSHSPELQLHSSVRKSGVREVTFAWGDERRTEHSLALNRPKHRPRVVTGRTFGPSLRKAALGRLGLSMDPEALQPATEPPFSLQRTWQRTFGELARSSEQPALPHQPSTHTYPVVTVGLWFSSDSIGGKFAPMLWTRRSDSPRICRTDICGPTGLSPGSDSEDGACEISVARIVSIRGVRAEWSTKGQSAIILRRGFLK